MDGFNECRGFNDFGDYQKRLEELHKDEIKEISRSSLRKDDEETIALRERLGVFGDEETDIDEVWKIKGIRTQVEFVYNRLVAYNVLITGSGFRIETNNPLTNWEKVY